ncbi:MAG: hypothetical protein FWD57_12640 [Polyangiaceae bacterium]|nr:hypothetical protein [Polyangiaceae bacterium]
MHRSVENVAPLIEHPVRDASLGSLAAYCGIVRYLGLIFGAASQFGRVVSSRKMRSPFSSIPLGMHRSVENVAPLIEHPVRDASLGSLAAFCGIVRYLGLIFGAASQFGRVVSYQN